MVLYKTSQRWDEPHSVVAYERINKQLNYEGYGEFIEIISKYKNLFQQQPNTSQSNLFISPQGLFAVTFAVCLLSMTVAQPIFLLDPISTAAFTTAGGLVLTSAAGTVTTIPTATLALGALAAKKVALLKILSEQ